MENLIIIRKHLIMPSWGSFLYCRNAIKCERLENWDPKSIQSENVVMHVWVVLQMDTDTFRLLSISSL